MRPVHRLATHCLVALVVSAAQAQLSKADDPPLPADAAPTRPADDLLQRWKDGRAVFGWMRQQHTILLGVGWPRFVDARVVKPERIRSTDVPGFQFQFPVDYELEALPDLEQPFGLNFSLKERVPEKDQVLRPLARVDCLRRFKHLVQLDIAELTDEELGVFIQLPQIRDLTVRGDGITDRGVKTLAGLGNVTTLFLQDTPVTDEGMNELVRMKQLERLDLFETRVTDAGLAPLAKLPKLRELDLEGLPITDRGLTILADTNSLESLRLVDTNVTDEGMSILARIRSLRDVNLSATDITDRGLERLAESANIHAIRLKRTRVSDVGMQSLAKMSGLTHVDISQTAVSDDGLAELARLPDLESLDIGYTMVTDVGMGRLASFPKLKEIHFLGNEGHITLRGLLKLSKVKHLKRVTGAYGLIENDEAGALNEALPHVDKDY
jgi:internalin A